GKRPAPFRTRKLSPSAPMVLHARACGRAGHRRTHTLNIREGSRETGGTAHRGPRPGALLAFQPGSLTPKPENRTEHEPAGGWTTPRRGERWCPRRHAVARLRRCGTMVAQRRSEQGTEKWLSA